jgi:hypothetical protein
MAMDLGKYFGRVVCKILITSKNFVHFLNYPPAHCRFQPLRNNNQVAGMPVNDNSLQFRGRTQDYRSMNCHPRQPGLKNRVGE